MKKLHDDRVTHAIEFQQLKSKNETLTRMNALLSKQLLMIKETNTQLDSQISMMRTEEYVDVMSNYAYIRASASALRTARHTLSADQLGLFIGELEKYLADNPPAPGRELPLADLQDLCDFSKLPEGVEIGDPVSDEEDDDQENEVKRTPIGPVGEEDDPGDGEQRDLNIIEHKVSVEGELMVEDGGDHLVEKNEKGEQKGISHLPFPETLR